jgi:hypothetical protein
VVVTIIVIVMLVVTVAVAIAIPLRKSGAPANKNDSKNSGQHPFRCSHRFLLSW